MSRSDRFLLWVYGCNCGTLSCYLDSILRRLHIRWRWLCDIHDETIRGIR